MVALPGQSASLRPTRPAKPSLPTFGLSVPVEVLAAPLAGSTPPAFGHVCLSATLWPGADLDAFTLPDRIVPVAMPNQRVRDLVEYCVSNLIGGVVALNEVD